MGEQPGYLTPLRTELDNLRAACKEWADRADTYRTRAETAEAELATVRHTLELRSAALDRVTRNALDGLIANGTLTAEDCCTYARAAQADGDYSVYTCADVHRQCRTRHVTQWEPIE